MATQDQQNRNSIPQSRQSLQGNLPKQTFKVHGMKTDLSESSFENEYAFENKNMRINVVDEDNTLMNLTNERGTKFAGEIRGIPIGVKRYAADKTLVVTTESEGHEDVALQDILYASDVNTTYAEKILEVNPQDRVYSVEMKPDGTSVLSKLIKKSNLNWSAVHPLEIEHYKDGDKDNFYFADGVNNLKTFVKEGDGIVAYNDRFDYNCKITGDERITAELTHNSLGEFYSGVVEYCFAYITKQGHKTGIIDISDMLYLAEQSEGVMIKIGLAPNKRCPYVVKLNITNLSDKYEDIECYSLFRSTLDGEITVRKVFRSKIGNVSGVHKVQFTDYNKGEICSYGELLTRFNSVLIPSTMTQKSSTLFLGGIRTNNYENLKKLFVDSSKIRNVSREMLYICDQDEYDKMPLAPRSGAVDSLIEGYDIMTASEYHYFLKENLYYYGLQFQDRYGNWSPVISIGSSKDVKEVYLNEDYVAKIIHSGYVAVRVMIDDIRRVRKTVCEGISVPCVCFGKEEITESRYENPVSHEVRTYRLETFNPIYGIDYYAPYFPCVSDNNIWALKGDIYDGGKKIRHANDYSDIYSPDIEFNENFVLRNSCYKVKYLQNDISLSFHKINVAVNGNIGVLYNGKHDSYFGTARISDSNGSGYYYWIDAITGYQKALQLICNNSEEDGDIDNENILLSLYQLNNWYIEEKPSKYKIYLWQPGGSLNDSDGKTSVLRYKQVSRVYYCERHSHEYYDSVDDARCYLYDGTSNNIPVEGAYMNPTMAGSTDKVYSGIVNMTIYPEIWSIDSNLGKNVTSGNKTMWDDDQAQICDGYSPATLQSLSFVGQPVEIWREWTGLDVSGSTQIQEWREAWQYVALAKLFVDNQRSHLDRPYKMFRGGNNDNLGAKIWMFGSEVYNGRYKYGHDWIVNMEATPETDNGSTGSSNWFDYPIKVRVTNNYNRSGNIKVAYKTPRHIVAKLKLQQNKNYYVIVEDSNVVFPRNEKSDIENGHWIVCSKKHKLEYGRLLIDDVDIKERYYWDKYECLKTEPYSLNDENQVTCVMNVNRINSYINPLCRYDRIRNRSDYNGITSDVMNKMNMVYNQKNNFFIFSGITEDTVTANSMSNTILYSDIKVNSEKDDTFVNFDSTNFYTIDSHIKTINKLINFKDQLLCFSDDAIVQVLYDEKIVINTDSVQALGLASTDKIAGTQLVSDTYGCMNKWSMDMYNNALYFSDDLSKKLIEYNGEFLMLNETLSIETLNNRIMKRNVWNPLDWGNTKLNVDGYSKDVHYTCADIDISLNTMIGAFTSLYSYEKIPYMLNVGDYSVALKNISKSKTELWLMREGDYNYFFGKYEPYWTTVIVNQNSLVNKMLSNIEFSTEAYETNGDILLPIQNFTFDHVSFWNDYQENKLAVDYRMYGQSLLKKKFRTWRINRFRDSSRMLRRNYDHMANTWHYLKLSTEKENNNKLTFHWLNVNYY